MGWALIVHTFLAAGTRGWREPPAGERRATKNGKRSGGDEREAAPSSETRASVMLVEARCLLTA